MQVITVLERPLNDDTLYIADDGKVFSGNYVAILEYFTYANEWSDRRNLKRFRSLNAMQKYINKHYPEFEGLA